jgi:hypothetical protein
MLLNLTNHPSPRWTEKQLSAANDIYGGVVDLPFPNIPSGATTEAVDALAEEYVQKVMAAAPVAVLLQGEFTFVYALTARLQARGMTVVVGTSERNVEEREGKKIVQFNFVQFRAYPEAGAVIRQP